MSMFMKKLAVVFLAGFLTTVGVWSCQFWVPSAWAQTSYGTCTAYFPAGCEQVACTSCADVPGLCAGCNAPASKYIKIVGIPFYQCESGSSVCNKQTVACARVYIYGQTNCSCTVSPCKDATIEGCVP